MIDDPAYAAVRTQLATRLTQLLTDTGDPRVVGGGEQFDEYPYLGGAPLSPEFEQAKKKARSNKQ